MLSEELRAQGWIEHDGRGRPTDAQGSVRILMRVDGQGVFDQEGARWDWAVNPKSPSLNIIAYKPEAPDA